MLAHTLIGLIGLLAVQQTRFTGTRVGFPARLPVAKYQRAETYAPNLKVADSVGVGVTAQAALLMDAASGKVLFEKNADETLPIASMTKLVTAMTFLDAKPNMQEEVEVLPEDEDEETRSVIDDYEVLTKKELLQALLIGSVNKAAHVLARTTGGKEAFVLAMNEKVRTLSMRGATFVDPSGIHPENRANAHEVAMILRAALAYPEIREMTGQPSLILIGRASGKPYEIKNTNLLLTSYLHRDPYRILAGKTGSLPQAGYCLTLATRFERAHDVIAVVLNSENHFSRFQDVKAMTTWAFASYEWPKRSPLVVRDAVSSRP